MILTFMSLLYIYTERRFLEYSSYLRYICHHTMHAINIYFFPELWAILSIISVSFISYHGVFLMNMFMGPTKLQWHWVPCGLYSVSRIICDILSTFMFSVFHIEHNICLHSPSLYYQCAMWYCEYFMSTRTLHESQFKIRESTLYLRLKITTLKYVWADSELKANIGKNY